MSIKFKKTEEFCIAVRRGGKTLAHLVSAGGWVFEPKEGTFTDYSSRDLRHIADKLDELNKGGE